MCPLKISFSYLIYLGQKLSCWSSVFHCRNASQWQCHSSTSPKQNMPQQTNVFCFHVIKAFKLKQRLCSSLRLFHSTFQWVFDSSASPKRVTLKIPHVGKKREKEQGAFVCQNVFHFGEVLEWDYKHWMFNKCLEKKLEMLISHSHTPHKTWFVIQSHNSASSHIRDILWK